MYIRPGLLNCSQGYDARAFYEKSPELKTAIDQIASGFFSPEQPHMFKDLMDNLLNHDRFKLLADFDAYMECQERVSAAYKVVTSLFAIRIVFSRICFILFRMPRTGRVAAFAILPLQESSQAIAPYRNMPEIFGELNPNLTARSRHHTKHWYVLVKRH